MKLQQINYVILSILNRMQFKAILKLFKSV